MVSDANKVLSSVSYATFKSSLAIVQADVTGLTTGDGPTFDHVHMTNQIYRSVETNITASVTQTQAGAYGLTKDINAITVIATSYDTVRLPPAEAGRIVIVMNTVSGKYLQIFPASGDDLGNGVDISTSVLGTTVYTLIFVAYDNTHWRKQTNS